jgi:hypothetical protein
MLPACKPYDVVGRFTTCAAIPTGTPTAFTRKVPLAYNNTNKQLYGHNEAATLA